MWYVVAGFEVPVLVGTASSLELAMRPGYSAANWFNVAWFPESAADKGISLMRSLVPTRNPAALFVASEARYGSVTPQACIESAA